MATGVAAPSSQAPASKSFGTMKREVADFVRSPDDPEALWLAGVGINNGINKLNMRIWWWALTYQDISLVENQMDYSLVNDFKRSMVLERIKTNGHSSDKYHYYDPDHFLELYRTSGTGGMPTAATIFNAQVAPVLSLNVGPSAVFVNQFPRIRHRYYRKYATLSADQQVIDVPAEGQLFLTWYAREEMCAVYRPQLFSLARAERNDVWLGLVSDQSEHHLSNWSE